MNKYESNVESIPDVNDTLATDEDIEVVANGNKLPPCPR
jgi:hypothetical protein